jgi:hypothetical protein
VGMEQMDTEVVETVAGVARLPRRAAELAWTQADVAGPRSSHQLLALGILEIAHNLSRTRELVERYGGDVQPTSADARADIAAARARVMHTLYVGAHGTAVALRDYAADLRDRLRLDTQRRWPVDSRPNVREIEAAEAMASRFEVFEQLAAGYVAPHPVTASVLGGVRPTPRPSRLQSALTAWEIQVHCTLATVPDAADLVRIGRIQALIASAAAVVTEAAGQKTEIDPEMTDRVAATLDASQVAWSRLAKRWGELTSPDSRTDPALTRAAGEVRAAIAATASTPTGWATPDQIASRVDLRRTLKSLHLSMVGAVDIAHVAQEVAATQPTLTGPARVIAMRPGRGRNCERARRHRIRRHHVGNLTADRRQPTHPAARTGSPWTRQSHQRRHRNLRPSSRRRRAARSQ